jgi:general secretion pathway protein A
MYAQYFGLKQEPFSIAPDPRLLFMSERHREALAHLLYGVGGAGGFVLLTGEIGTGKTTVCCRSTATSRTSSIRSSR